MKITCDLIREAYDLYNSKIFNDELPQICMRISNSRRKRGCVSVTYTGQSILPKLPNFMGLKVDSSDLRIDELVISDYYEFSDKSFEQVLVHEMIHIQLFSQGIMKTSGGDIAHGKEFIDRVQDIAIYHGIQIDITDKSGDTPRLPG